MVETTFEVLYRSGVLKPGEIRVLKPGEFRSPQAIEVRCGRSTWTVRVGQVWQDCDKRVGTRKVQVIGFWWPGQGSCRSPSAQCLVIEHSRGGPGPKVVRILLERMRPTSTGYKLLGEAPPRASHASSLPY
jgi:hypothetical protein